MSLIEKLAEFNTSEISDALDASGIEGALLGIKPLRYGKKLIGPAFTVEYAIYESVPEDFKSAGNYIDEVPENSIIIIDNKGRVDCTTWGGILTQVALMRGISGTVVHGAVRDIEQINELQYPIYASSIYMRSGKNRVYKHAHQCDLNINQVKIKPGDIVVADDNGVLIVPQEHLHTVLSKAKNIKATEEAIINSVHEGMALAEARRIHRYDQPWLNMQEKEKS